MNPKLTVGERLISYYKNVATVKELTEINVIQFLDWIAIGHWQKEAEQVRKFEPGSKEYAEAKKKVPAVTIAGTFTERNDKSIKEFTGLIAVDIDKLTEKALQSIFLRLRQDKYVYAAFRSIGGRGLCILFRIDPSKYAESFAGLEQYFAEEYSLVVGFDRAVKNISRLRLVSYDPHCYVEREAVLFKQYPKKEHKRKPENFIHTERDLEYVLEQIEARRLEFHDTGSDYVRAGLALANKYGATGENYFLRISQFRHDYNEQEAVKLYAYFCRNARGEVGIATFYFICKQQGLQIISPKSKDIAILASQSKKNTNTLQGAIEKITGLGGFSLQDATEIATQVYESEIEFSLSESIFEEMELFLRANYPMKRNAITRFLEDPNGKVYEETDFNSIYIEARKTVNDKINFQDLERLIRSSFTPSYNPFLDFFARHKSRQRETGLIKKLGATLIASSALTGKSLPEEYVLHFLRKWLLGIVYSMHGIHSATAFVITGGQNKGKTEWFRRLLPSELMAYYGESELDRGQDDEILMTKKLILFNDEFGGMTNKDAKRFKNLTSKQTFSIREPYGRSHVDLQRIAVLCGSCNENDILNDPTGNRRILPIHIVDINQDLYNSIDKIDLFLEVYDLFKAGETHHMNANEITVLGENTAEFQELSLERELIEKYFTVPQERQGLGISFWSATEIKVFLEKVSMQKLGLKKLSQEMQRLGFQQEINFVRFKTKRGYKVFSETEIAPN